MEFQSYISEARVSRHYRTAIQTSLSFEILKPLLESMYISILTVDAKLSISLNQVILLPSFDALSNPLKSQILTCNA